jgi:hypothetical protein
MFVFSGGLSGVFFRRSAGEGRFPSPAGRVLVYYLGVTVVFLTIHGETVTLTFTFFSMR